MGIELIARLKSTDEQSTQIREQQWNLEPERKSIVGTRREAAVPMRVAVLKALKELKLCTIFLSSRILG